MDFYARSSAGSKRSKRRKVEELASLFTGPDVAIYPFTTEVVLKRAIALKSAGFGAAWMSSCKAGHVESHHDVPLWLDKILAQCRRAVNRVWGHRTEQWS
eukprot:6403923-Amphidinium_carterae.2